MEVGSEEKIKEKIIQRGAEAVIIRRGKNVLKKRVVKGYRFPDLDKVIRKRRTRREAKLLVKAGGLINVPAVDDVSEFEIEMEFIDGLKLSESLDGMKNWKKVCLEIGKGIAKLHDADIIHGDLTTSNMIWFDGKLDSSSFVGKTRSARELSRKSNRDDRVGFDDNVWGGGKLYFIDFGLGFSNGKIEDKAVDLHLIKQALEAKHFAKFENYWKEILKGYGKSKKAKDVLVRLEKVEKRGRYKAQY